MKGTLWLSDAIHEEELKKGELNIIAAPVGCGKTTWALDSLSTRVSKPYKMLYLIDTVNGKEQLLRRENTQYYSDRWLKFAKEDPEWFGERLVADKIVVVTYAKFALLTEISGFSSMFELIVCDEIHNLAKFSNFIMANGERENLHKKAKAQIEKIVSDGKTLVVGLSATPKRAIDGMICKKNVVAVDGDVRHWETAETVPYVNAVDTLKRIGKQKKGLYYVARIQDMKKAEQAANEAGIKAVAIWSTKNPDHPMSEGQQKAREHILNNSELPPEYDLVIINASAETCINLNGHIDYIMTHTTEKEAQIQVRGRYRNDLKQLYVLDYKACGEVPEEFLGRKLFTPDKKQLCSIMQLRTDGKNPANWPTVKQRLLNCGYVIEEGRENNLRYAIITRVKTA